MSNRKRRSKHSKEEELKRINQSDRNTKKIKKKNKKKKKKSIILDVILCFILLIVIGVLGFMIYSTIQNGWGVKGIIKTAMGQSEEKLQNLDTFNVLIMGVSEDIGAKLTDTIMVASYNPKKQEASILSIPRDTFIGKNKNKATSYDKINALYQKGVDKSLQAVNEITGLDLKYYIVIDNNALVELVDEIGGVEFDVPIDMEYDDSTQDLHIDLQKGLQKLNGDQAEQLVRFRKNNNGTSYPSSYGDNDIGRMRTQREFIKEVAKQTLQLKNITKIKSFVDIFNKHVKTNITNWDTIKQYVPYLIDFDTENLQTGVLPGDPIVYNKLWFFAHNKKETQSLVEEMFLKQDEEDNVEENEINSTNTN